MKNSSKKVGSIPAPQNTLNVRPVRWPERAIGHSCARRKELAEHLKTTTPGNGRPRLGSQTASTRYYWRCLENLAPDSMTFTFCIFQFLRQLSPKGAPNRELQIATCELQIGIFFVRSVT